MDMHKIIELSIEQSKILGYREAIVEIHGFLNILKIEYQPEELLPYLENFLNAKAKQKQGEWDDFQNKWKSD